MMAGDGAGRGNAGKKRTALILGAIALAFFAAIMLKYWLAE